MNQRVYLSMVVASHDNGRIAKGDFDSVQISKTGYELWANKWEIQVQEGGTWKIVPIYNTDIYSTLPDTYNIVHPAQTLKADRVRIVMRPVPAAAVGILSIDVETR